MFRYRCPECQQILQASELRAGQSTICPKCFNKITIPADRSHWLGDESPPASDPRLATASSASARSASPAPGADSRAAEAVVTSSASREASEMPAAPPARGFSTVVEPESPEPASRSSSMPLSAPPPRYPGSDYSGASSASASSLSGGWKASGQRSPAPRVVTFSSAASDGDVDGAVSFNSPLALRSELDIAAELTNVLTTRMKPPPQPPRDLYLSTAFWMLLTGMGVVLLSLTLFKNVDYLIWVKFIGWVQVVVGYVWIVVLTFRRNPVRAVYCAVPPITFWYLLQKRYRRYRPLRFVLTGFLLVLFGWLAPNVLSETRRLSGADQPLVPVLEPDVEALPKVEQLRYYRDKRQSTRLIELLQNLDRTEPLFASSPAERVELAAELRQLADPAITGDPSIRAAAIPAYVRWSGDDARSLLLAAMQGHPNERKQAILLLHRWKNDPDVARVLASRLGHREDSELAKNSLALMDPATVFQAVKPLLIDKRRDKLVHFAVLDLLTTPGIGSEEVIRFLQAEKDKFSDLAIQNEIRRAIQRIRDNLGLPAES